MVEAAFYKLFKGTHPKILCVGKNYLDHVKEMGGTAMPAAPVIFMKPLTSLQRHTVPIVLPPGFDIHHECNFHTVELAVLIGKRGKNINEAVAMTHVGGYMLGLDLTARNLQSEAKKQGLPWDIAKGFDGSLPISQLISRDAVNDPHALSLKLVINGEVKQQGNTADMHYKIPFLISYLSSIFTLNKGDVIMTGTPPGVGPIKSGDVLQAECKEGEKEVAQCEFKVA